MKVQIHLINSTDTITMKMSNKELNNFKKSLKNLTWIFCKNVFINVKNITFVTVEDD